MKNIINSLKDSIFPLPFSDETLMLLNIILSGAHIIFSSMILYDLGKTNDFFQSSLIYSIIVCSLIFLYSIDAYIRLRKKKSNLKYEKI